MATEVVTGNGTGAVSVSMQTVPTQIVIARHERRVIRVPIVGRTPYIPNKWSEKSLRMMREAQSGQGRVKKAREAKRPEEDAFQATYWIVPNEIAGAPAVSFKAALIGAVRAFEGITMVAAKTMFHVYGEGPEQLVRLLDAEWQMREDTPRNATGVADLRYRNQIWPWRADVEIEFPPGRISAESVLALMDEAGRGGIGDWRPSAPKSLTGIYGQWTIDAEREVTIV